MKAILFSCIFIALAQASYTQTEKLNYKETSAKLQQWYNAQQYDSIFQLFSPEMQAALPLNKTKDFFSGLFSTAGKIKQRDFVEYASSAANYTTQFERGTFSIFLSVNETPAISGLLIQPCQPANLPSIERNTTPLQLPFSGEWTVIWGGDTKEQNYHVAYKAQKNAFDMVITGNNNLSYKTDGKSNEDYYAFGQLITAPCDAEVVLAVDGIKENKPGTLNPVYIPGNSIILKTAANEYILLAHLKQFSLKVKQGDKVKQGRLLGLCGNSGNSSEPHLHLHMQNAEDMTIATGVKCYFSQLVVNGSAKNDYSPVQGDKIQIGNK